MHLSIMNTIIPMYLDPGSGSMIIQMILTAILGIGLVVRIFWARIKKFFNKNNDS
jgi:hypothetical protein